MKKTAFIFSLFVASLCLATNPSDSQETATDVGCTQSTSSTVTQNPDGSSTRTTTTTLDCDTPQELAQYQAFLKALGMGM